MVKRIIIILFSCFAFLTGSGDTLWWTVDDTATVDGQDIYQFVSSYGTWTETDPDTGEEFSGYNVGARVRMTNPDGSTDIIPVAFPDFPDDRFDYLEFFDGGGANAAGFGTGTWAGQSVLHESPIYNSELLAETAFMVELGELTYDDVLDIVGFETIAKSDTVFGDQIRDAVFLGGVNVPAKIQWTPTEFHTVGSVPEPSTSILCLVGASLLMLRRKRS